MNGGLTKNERREYMERYADQEERVIGKPLRSLAVFVQCSIILQNAKDVEFTHKNAIRKNRLHNNGILVKRTMGSFL